MELELNKPTFGTVAGRSAVLSLSYDYKENKNVGREKLPKTLQDYFVYMNDPHLASCIQSRFAGVQSKLYDIEYNGNMPEMFELVKDVLDNLDNNRIMREMLNSLLLGYSVSEIFWSIDNGFYVISDVIGKPSWWFDFDDNNLAYFKGEDNDKRILLDNNKFIVVQHNASYDNPHGEALLAKCYYALAFKKAGLELWVRFLDKYGIPVTTAKVANASNEVLKEVVSMLDDLKANGNAAFSDSVDVSMLDASGAKSDILFKDFIHYCNTEISKAILSQTLTTEQQSTGGTQAMAKTHLEVRKDVIDMDAKMIESAYNKLIRSLVNMNFNDYDELPKFVLYDELDIDMQLADRDVKLAGIGTFKFTKTYLMNAHNFKEEDIEMIESSPAAFSETIEYDLDTFENDTKLILKPVIAAIKNGSSFAEIEKQIFELFPEIDTTKIEDYISQGVNIAYLSGLLGDKK